jgi:N-acetyl sugar amidotransferase
MLKHYKEEDLKNDYKINYSRPYQQCAISVMDTIADPNISFDERGICNYYYEYLEVEKNNIFKGDEGRQKLLNSVNQIKLLGKGQKYDCVLGISGGVDSSYLALLAKEQGLRPLMVHFDYGWNLELAVQNIENIVKKLNFDLYTEVMDWEEMKSLQRSYFRSSVLDLDVPADHAIFGSLYQIADKFNIKTILSGKNTCTEAILPKAWNYNKFDLKNLKHIHRSYENTPLNKLPLLGLKQLVKYQGVKKINIVEILDYVDYDKGLVKKILAEKLEWKDYGGKHYENVYTKLYQSYILPVKFGIDKRKAHLSNLIFSRQITKEFAINELSFLPYKPDTISGEIEYVSKKLEFSYNEFLSLVNQPNKSHLDFETDAKQRENYLNFIKKLKPITALINKLRK